MSRTVARFYDDNGNLRDQLEPDNPDNNCYGYNVGLVGEMCGGCDGCLMMQAVRWGADYEWEEIDDEPATKA